MTNSPLHLPEFIHPVQNGRLNGWLITRPGASLLIDCPCENAGALIAKAGLPRPEIILHTHVQEEHCREWGDLSDVDVRVPSGSEDVATLSEEFAKARFNVWAEDRDWSARGAERFGIAGCTTERPPMEPLRLGGVLSPGTEFKWGDFSFDVIPLPGHGKHSVGLLLKDHGILFSGDLLMRGGRLVNFYDLERGYGIDDGRVQLLESLQSARDLNPALCCPATGDLVDTPAIDCAKLAQRVGSLLKPFELRPDEKPRLINFKARRNFGVYRQIDEGLYQNNNAGNIILFVDGQGRGLVVDPGPCVWRTWEESSRQMLSDLDMLEAETGLKKIELALFTHPHGDHVQFAEILKEKHNCRTAATADVAELLRNPEKYDYPCMLDWYNFPVRKMDTDIILGYETPFFWNDTRILPLRLPGHCHAHAGFFLEWEGRKILCTGDSIMYGQGPVSTPAPIMYNDAAWPDRGFLRAYERAAKLRPDLILGGHSTAFCDPDGAIIADFIHAAETEMEKYAKALGVENHAELTAAMTPPGFDSMRRTLENL